jgi:hypothetical protein
VFLQSFTPASLNPSCQPSIRAQVRGQGIGRSRSPGQHALRDHPIPFRLITLCGAGGTRIAEGYNYQHEQQPGHELLLGL